MADGKGSKKRGKKSVRVKNEPKGQKISRRAKAEIFRAAKEAIRRVRGG